MSTSSRNRKSSAGRLAGFVLAVSVAGSGFVPAQATVGNATASGYYENALGYFEKRDFKAAEIELKNALQIDPNLLPALVLLGATDVQKGNGETAEEVLRKAIRLGADPSGTVVNLARALLLQRKFRELLDEIQPDAYPAGVRVDLLALRGHAALEMGDRQVAKATFEAAHKLDAAQAAPLVGLAMLSLREGALAQAETFADRARTLAPDDAEVWNVKASIAHLRGLDREAIDAYGKVLAQRPEHLDSRLARAGLLLVAGDLDQAMSDLERLRNAYPREPRIMNLYAQALKASGKSAEAQAALSEVAALIDALEPARVNNNPPVLLVGGEANLALNRLEKARELFARYLELMPEHAEIRRVQADVLLRLKDHDGVIKTVGPLLKAAPDDPAGHYLMGMALMAKGRHAEAAEYFTRAAEQSQGAPEARSGLALSWLGQGRRKEAAEALERIAAEHPSQEATGIALTLMHLKRGENKEAVRSAERFAKAQPDNPVSRNLLGSARMAAGELNGAETEFKAAVAADPAFLPARLNLGKLALLRGKPDDAEKIYQEILKDRPGDARIMQELAHVADARGDQAAVFDWLERATANDKKSIPPRLEWVERLLAAAQPDKALAVAQQAEGIAPDNLDVLDALARANLAAGKKNIAQVILQRMAKLAGHDVDRLYTIALEMLAAEDTRSSAWALEDIIKYDPDNLPAAVALVDVRLLKGELDAAEAAVANMRQKFPSSGAVHRLAGDLNLRRQRTADAAAEFQSAFQREPNLLHLMRYFQSSLLVGQGSEALKAVETWHRNHPNDPAAANALAEAYLQSGDRASAKRLYLEIAKAAPGQVAIWNNLANLAVMDNQPEALDYAKKALALAPDDPSINDTLGWVLVKQGEALDGLVYLRTASIRAANNPTIHYHIGAALAQLGRTDDALKSLDSALKLPEDFPDRAAAMTLKEQLRNKP